jgi:hypothetical protein
MYKTLLKKHQLTINESVYQTAAKECYYTEHATLIMVLNFIPKSQTVSNYGRCFSAPSTRSFYRTSEQHHAKCTLEGELINGSRVNLRTKHRCMSAPKTSRNVLSVCNTLTKASPSNRQTVHPRSAEKFSNSLLSKTIEFDKESMSDVMSFSDNIIELQLDACSTSDDSSIANVRWRPRSCISFRRTVQLVPNSKHHCVTPLKNRPHSSPNPVRPHIIV